MKTIIYLVRHADVNNPKHVIYNRMPNFRLSQKGLKQAEKLRKFFLDKKICCIYSSPLLRARSVAKILANGKKIHFSDLLLEANYTKWEGLDHDKRPKSEMKIYIDHPTELKVGETLFEIESRMRKKIEMILKRCKGGRIIVVSHADPIAVARLSYEGRSLDLINKTPVHRASVTELIFEDNKFIRTEYFNVAGAEREQP